MRFSNILFTPLLVLSSFFATFPSSTTYKVQSYSVGPGGTNTSSSTTYSTQATVGEQANGTESGSTLSNGSGSILTEQINIPGAPTLSNGSSTYYNRLNFIINTSSNPTDTTYAVAVSTNNFTSTLGYVQSTGALSGTQYYQSYTAWGGAGGSFVTGLTASTTYEIRVAAMQGKFTNTNFGAYATASTVAFTMTFSLSPSTLTLTSLIPATVVTSSNITVNFATTAVAGGDVYVYGQHGGLYSALRTNTITSATTNLATAGSGFGLQVTSPTQTYGGPLTSLSPFNGTSNNVGVENSGPQNILTSSTAILGGTASVNVQAKSATSTPSSTDYTETLNFIAAGSY